MDIIPQWHSNNIISECGIGQVRFKDFTVINNQIFCLTTALAFLGAYPPRLSPQAISQRWIMEKQLHPNLVKLPAFNSVSSADNSLSLSTRSCGFFIGFFEYLYTLYHVLFKHTQHTKWSTKWQLLTSKQQPLPLYFIFSIWNGVFISKQTHTVHHRSKVWNSYDFFFF